MPDFATGTLLKGRYRLRRLLGRGGMAGVWLGHDDVLDRPVAIKVLADTISSDPEFLARFRREAMVAAGLSHPNLVDIYDYSESMERPYLVMEFIPGRDLGSLIAGEEWIDRDKLARELLGAVAHIHAAGIVHRDIKPHNILLEQDRAAKLIDFGIALPPDATALTQTGLILATRRYAAPEVLAGRAAGPRSDLYSCGVVLEACGDDGSPALRALVSSLTEADPGRRPPTAHDALARLEDLDDRGQATEPFTPTFDRAPTGRPPIAKVDTEPPTRIYSRRTSNRKRWAAVGAILAVSAAVAVAIALALGSGGSSGREAGANSPGQAASSGHAGSGSPPSGPAAKKVRADNAAAQAPVPTAGGEDPALGSALNQEGFELIQAGSYEAAVPVLERAVRSFPAGTEEVEYAYALFNLGDALLRSGRPEAAIPVLELRLQIPDQTDTVRRELETAREQAG
jgi:predicted Ser/Thr protein kinase/TolA-binding protein